MSDFQKVGDRLVWTFATDGVRKRVAIVGIYDDGLGTVLRLRDRWGFSFSATDEAMRSCAIPDPMPGGSDAECFALVDSMNVRFEFRATGLREFSEAMQDVSQRCAAVLDRRENEKARIRQQMGDDWPERFAGRTITDDERAGIENAVADKMLGLSTAFVHPLDKPHLKPIVYGKVTNLDEELRAAFVEAAEHPERAWKQMQDAVDAIGIPKFLVVASCFRCGKDIANDALIGQPCQRDGCDGRFIATKS